MNRTPLFLLVGFALGCAATVGAAPVSVTASTSLVSQYMFRGQRLSGAAFQPTVEVGAGNLLLAAVASTPLDPDKVPDSSDPEIDLTGSYAFALPNQWSLTPGFTSYHFPKAPTNAGYYRSTFEPNLALSYTGAGLKLTSKVYYDVVLDGATYELTAFYAYPLTRLGTELDFTAVVGTYKWNDFANDAAPPVKAWGDYWLLGVTVPYQLAANQRVAFGLAYSEGRDAFTKQGSQPQARNPLAMGRAVVSVSYSWTF